MKIIASFSIFFLFLIFFANAQAISLSEKEISIFAGETKTIYLTIKNEKAEEDTFAISIWPERFDGVAIISEKYSITLLPYSKDIISLTISSIETVRDVRALVKISVRSKLTGQMVSEFMIVNVKGKILLSLDKIVLEKKAYEMDEVLKGEIFITNKGLMDETVFLDLKISKDLKIVHEEIEKVFLGAGKTVKVPFLLQIIREYKPGFYYVEANLLDQKNKTIGKKLTFFEILRKIDYKIEKNSSAILFGIKTEIDVENTGNDLATFEVKEYFLPFFKYLLRSYPEPDRIIEEKEKITYVWLVTLEPEEKAKISYQIFVLPPILALLFIFGFVVFVFLRTFKITLTKTTFYSGPLVPEKEIEISIDVKNKGRKEVKNITIEEFVPGIIRVVPRFGTMKPTIKRVEEGISLIWKIPSMKAQEERILTYVIKPAVKIVGSLRLPGSKVTYYEEKKRKTLKFQPLVIGE